MDSMMAPRSIVTERGQGWRDAVAHASRARRWARRAATERTREAEWHYAALSVTATTLALRDWALWAHVTSRVPVPGSGDLTRTVEARLSDLWANLPTLARANGRSPVTVPAADLAALDDLDAWARLLRHDTDEARQHVHRRLSDLGRGVSIGDELQALSAELAATMVVRAGHLFTAARDATGLSVPRPHQGWMLSAKAAAPDGR
jgi:hypothetical protein